MVKALGLADIIASVLFFGTAVGADVPLAAIIFFALYLVGKGLFFVVLSLDAGSIADIAAGILLAAVIFAEISHAILWGAAAFLFLKGLASLFA